MLPKEHTDLLFDVKAPTRVPKEFADPRVAGQLLPTMNFVHLCLQANFSMFADFSQISILVSRTCLFSPLTSNLSFYGHRFILNRLDMSNPQCYNLTNLKENNR